MSTALVLGGSGFVGASLAHTLLAVRDDVYATATRLPAWRLDDVAPAHVRQADLLVDSNLDQLLDARVDFFGKGPLEIGMALEDKSWEGWKRWAAKQIEDEQSMRAQMFSGPQNEEPVRDGLEDEFGGNLELEEPEKPT